MASASDLAQLDGDELATRLGDARRELFNLRFQLATGQLDNPARVGQVRHDVARILTVLRAREILEAEGAYVAPTTERARGRPGQAGRRGRRGGRAGRGTCRRRRGRVGGTRSRRSRPRRPRTMTWTTSTRTTTSTTTTN